MTKKITQTAGRTQLGDFAPMFAHLNDDVLFGEVWNEAAIDVKTKCIITVVSLMASGITDSSLGFHLQNAKNNGVTKEEIAVVAVSFRMVRMIWPSVVPVEMGFTLPIASVTGKLRRCFVVWCWPI